LTESHAFVVTAPVDQIDLASDRLWQLGVRAIEERKCAVPGLLELWTWVGDDDVAIDRAASTLDVDWTWRVEHLPAAPASTWRDFAGITEVSATLHLVPAWIESGDRDDAVVVVRIEPGGAFGLGDHPTTRLCASFAESTIAARSVLGEATTVLDVGCGTGVLSVVAAVLGATCVRAVDLSAEAIDVTNANALANGVGHLVDADTTAYAQLTGAYELVLANILAPVLIGAADDLRRLTAAAGTLVVSGVLATSHDHVIDAFAPMVVTETRSLDGWAAIALRHPQPV
jgi:ribosomal protein L11 methyltransferase